MKNDDYVFICKNCGSTGLRTFTGNKDMSPCAMCHSKNMQKLDLSVKEYLHKKRNKSLREYITQLFQEESESWESNLNQAQIEHESFKKKIENESTHDSHLPTCPICGSTSLSKITNAHKVGKMFMFGVFGMGENGKTWKCDNCGSRF